MPNIITHTLFADDMMELFDCPLFNERRRLFRIGSSGPDFLFFSGVSRKRLQMQNPLRKAGSLLHKSKINAFYQSALNSIRNEKDPGIREDMIAYVCGHLCHWALDSVMHPYIFYRTGNCTGRSSWLHHRFESLLDAVMLKIKRNLTIAEYDVSEETAHADKKEARALSRIYVPALKDLLNLDVRAVDLYLTLEDWHDMQKLFRDPHEKKSKVLSKLEKVLHLENLLTGYAVPLKVEDNIDLCNLLHQAWNNPSSGEISSDSVFDLYLKAQHRAAKAIKLFLEAITDAASENKLLSYLDNRSYDMGLNADTAKPMHLFSICDL